MKQLPIIIITGAALLLVGCSRPAILASPTLTLTPRPACRQSGTTKADQVFFPDSGETHAFTVYLPPCYSEYGDDAYPVLYWTAAGGPEIFATSDRLIRQGDIPAFIIIMVDISPEKGYGADAQIVDRVVPYIDFTLPHAGGSPAPQYHRDLTRGGHRGQGCFPAPTCLWPRGGPQRRDRGRRAGEVHRLDLGHAPRSTPGRPGRRRRPGWHYCFDPLPHRSFG